MAELKIAIVGPPRIDVDGEPLAVDTKKAIALLVYLAVGEPTRSREHLAGLLWPDSTEERSRAALRRTLTVLRSALGKRWVTADRNNVGLHVDDRVTLDLVALRGAPKSELGHPHDASSVCPDCVPALRATAELIRGDFLEGFSVSGAWPFEDWARTTGESVRLASGSLFDRLAEAEMAGGDYDGAVASLRRRLDLDPLHEPAHRRLMLAHAWAGDRAGSVEAYRSCVRILQDELGVAPLEETTELYGAILDEDLPRPPSAPRRVSHAIAATPPPEFVGRDQEWLQLRGAVDHGSPVLVTGAAGTGRSRLIDELAAALAAQSRRVLVARGRRINADAGYGILQSLLEQAIKLTPLDQQADWVAAEVARLIPDASAQHQPAATDRTQGRRLADAALRVLGAADAVIILDDAQWCDLASAQVLARALDELRTSVVLTFHPQDPATGHPLAELLRQPGPRTRPVATIDLGPLDESAVELLVAGRSPVPAADIYRVTQGVPLFVVAYLDADLASTDEALPQIRALLRRRIEELPPLAGQVLAVIATIGRPGAFNLVRDVSGRSEDEVLDAVELLLNRRMVREHDGTGELEVEHPLLGDAALHGATQVRRRILHRRIAEALDIAAGSSDLTGALEIARHFEAAGELTQAGSWFVRAGDHALEVYALDEAEVAYRDALAAGLADPAAVHVALGDIDVLRGRFDEALLGYETAAGLSDEDRLPAIEHRLGEVHRRLGRWDAAQYHYARAEAGHPVPSILLADWSLLALRQSDRERALELAQAALRAADTESDRSRAHDVMGVVADDPAIAESHFKEALATAGGDPILRMAALNNLSEVVAGAGELDRAVQLAREALELAVAVGDRHRQAALHDRLAGLHRMAGMTGESEEASRQAATLFASMRGPEDWEPELWRLTRW